MEPNRPKKTLNDPPKAAKPKQCFFLTTQPFRLTPGAIDWREGRMALEDLGCYSGLGAGVLGRLMVSDEVEPQVEDFFRRRKQRFFFWFR